MVQQMKIGYQGVQGSHSEDAALQLFSSQPSFKENNPNLVGFETFDAMIAELVNGKLDRVLVPLENSLAGTFFPILDLVLKNDVHIVGEYEHEEVQVLASLPGTTLASISEVRSHPYAFDQCRPFIASQLGGKKLVQSVDTAGSCAEIAKNKLNQVGAIASARAAKMYNLQVLSEIASEASVTRYALISKTPIVPERHTNPKTFVHVILKNQVGALMKAVSAFAHRDISISKIESRPSSRSIKVHKAWEYEIFIEVELGTNDPRMIKALENLEEFAVVKVLGSFPSQKFSKNNMSESDNPESPSFHKKISINTNQADNAKQFDDIFFWSSKPSKLDELEVFDAHDDQEMLNAVEAELIPIKDIVPDALEYKGLGVNGTVRRYQKAPSPSPTPSFHEEILQSADQKQEKVEIVQPEIIKILPIKRSISQNFVKDAIGDEIPSKPKKIVLETKQEEKVQKIVQNSISPKIPRKASRPQILVVNNYNYHQAVPSSAPYLSPRALKSLKHDLSHTIDQENSLLEPKSTIVNSGTTKNNIFFSDPINTRRLSKRNEEASADTLNDTEEITEESSHRKEKFWFKLTQIFRSLAMAIHTWITTWPGLRDPRVIALNGKGLLIAVLTFASLDVFLAIIKAFPKNFWCCWQVRKWDPVKRVGTVWAIIADHALLLDIVPMFANISLRIYSYRLSELVQNPLAVNSISNNGFSIVSDWANPVYSNFVQLILWGISIAATLLFHTSLRFHFFSFKYKTPSLGLMIIVKALLLLMDMCASSLFLYCFLVNLGINIFGTSQDIPLMLSIMAASPIISTAGNSLVNILLMYAFSRLQKSLSAIDALKSAFQKVFSPASIILSVATAFYIAVTSYLLNQLHIIEISSTTAHSLVGLVAWNPTQSVIWLIAVNFAINYLIGMAFTILYWTLKSLAYFGILIF